MIPRPTLAFFVLTRGWPWAQRREILALRFRIDRWLFAAWALPIVALLLAWVASGWMPGTRLLAPAAALVDTVSRLSSPAEAAKLSALSPLLLSLGLVGQALILGPLLNLPFMLSEEIGWRGWLWERWRPLGFWPHALATGVVWGLWHAPLILMGHNYPDAPVLGVGLMIVFCILLTPVLHHVRERGGTLWHACLFHGTLNAGATLSNLCIQSDGWVGRGIIGVPGFAVLGLMCGAVAVARWRVR